MDECAYCHKDIEPDQPRASSRGIGAFYHESCWQEGDEAGEEINCSFCGGDGWQESDDPLWDGQDEVPCKACGGSGQRRHQSVF